MKDKSLSNAVPASLQREELQPCRTPYYDLILLYIP